MTAAQGDALQMAVDARIAALAATARAGEQRTALMTAAGAIDTSGLTDAAAIAAANGAIAALKAAIAAAVDVDDTSMYQAQVTAAEAAVAAAQSALDHAAQTATLTSAVDGLQAIDLGNLSTQGAIAAAEGAIAAVRTALAAATELSDAEKAAAMAVLATANRTVMLAQGRLDIDGQKTVLSEAVDALDAIDLADLSTQAKIDAAQAAIIALDLALEAATDLTDAEKLDATVNVTVAKRAVASAQETLTANVGEQRTALMEAGTALGEIDLADLSTQDKIDAAQSAVNALKAALAAATHLSDAEKATYQSQLETATETVLTAQTGMDRDGRMVAQRTAINSAVSAAQTAVAGVNNDSTDSEVSAAEAAVKAVKDAIAAAADLSETDNAIAIAQGALKVLEPQLAAAKSKRQIAMDDKDKADRVAMAKLGKAMHAALAGPAADGTTVLNNITTHTLSSAGLAVDAAAGAGSLATDPGSVTLKAGDSTGSLGGWTGTNYAHTNNGTKVTNTAVVYTNQGAPKTEAFTTKYNVATTGDNKGYLTDTIDLSKVGGSVFVNSGTQVHTKAPREDAVYLDGTYDGASGEYKCVGDTCSVTNDGKGSPTSWSGTWTFKPNSGAQVSSPDAEYLYFGWWVSDDKDGVPTAASAFVGVVEPTANDLDRGNGGTTLTGGATYNGHAAGKFAMSNPLDGTGSAGHFTADATLTAKFGSKRFAQQRRHLRNDRQFHGQW